MKVVYTILLIFSTLLCEAQDGRIEFEKLFNSRILSPGSNEVVIHFKYTNSYTLSKKHLESENSIGDLFVGDGIEYYQNDKYEIFQSKNLQIMLDKKKKLMILSNVSDKGGYLSNFKMSQRKIFVDSSEIRMVNDTILNSIRLKYFSLILKKNIEIKSNIKNIEYFFKIADNSVYRIVYYYNNNSVISTNSMTFEELDRRKTRNFEKNILSKYFSKSGTIRQDFKGFQIVDNRR